MLAAVAPASSDVALTTNGVAAGRARPRRCAAAGLRRVTVSLDSLDDEVFRAMNDVGFPVARVLEASTRRPPPGSAGEGEHGRQARRERRVDRRRWPSASAARGHVLRLHRVHGRRQQQRLAAGRRRPGRARSLATIDARWPLEPVAPAYPGEVATATATWTAAARSASSPRSPSRSAAAARAPGCRPTASSTPACSPSAGHDLREMLRRRRDDERACRARSAASGAAAPTATRSCARARRRACAEVEMSHIGG